MTIAGGKKQTAESIKAAYPEANPKRKSRSSESTQGQKAEATGVEQLRTEVGKTRTSDEPEHDMDDDDFSKRSSQNLDLLRDLMIDKENDERSSLFAASSPPEIGNLHLAGQDHIRHMIRVKGAVRLVKELGLELAKRDAQVTLAKQRSEIWKRAFNKLLHQHELANLADTQHSAEIIQETHDALRELSEANIAIALSGAAADVMSAELVSATDHRQIGLKAARRVEPRDRGRPDAGIRAGGIGRAIDGSSSRSRTPSTQENSQRHSDDSPEESARKLSANISVPKHGRKSSLSATTVSSLTKKVLSSNRPTKLAGSLEDTLDKRKLAGKHNASADRNYNRAPMKSRKSSKATITTLSTKMLERSAFSDGMHDPPVSGKGNGDETYGPVELSTIANEGSLPPALTRSNEATSSTRLFLYDPWGFRYELVNDEDGTEVQPPDMSIETKKRICGVRRVSRRVLTWKELRADAASMQSDDNTYEPTSTVPDATKVTSEAVQRQASSKCRQTTANTLSRLRDTFYTYESLRKKAWEEYFTKYKAIPTEKGISKAEGLRVRDWMDFATSEKAYYAHYRTELYKGIPILLRPQLYKQCASAFDVMDETGYSRYRSTYLSGQVLAEDSRADIRLDSRRTFRQNLFFQEEGGYRRLEEVLGAFACAFPATGYCQGMNFVAAFLVLAMPTASDAFLLLIYLIRDVLPADYFSSGLQTAQADQRVLKVYVRTLLPALNEHLERHEIELGRVTLGWYLTLYTAYLPPEAAYRVWDVVFCRHQGSCALHEVALALLSLRQDELLSCGTDDEIYEILEGLCKDVDVEKLLQGCDGFRLAGLKPTSVQSLRSKAIRLTMSESRLQAERDRSRPMSLRSQDSDRKESRGEGGSSRDDGSLHDGSDVEPMMAR